MTIKHLLVLLLLGLFSTYQTPTAAEDILTTLLRFTGISSTPHTKGGAETENGDLWVVKRVNQEFAAAQKITTSGDYHSPLWLPGSDSLITVKSQAIVTLNSDGSHLKSLHTLTVATQLIGFDKTDPNQLLVRQDNNLGILTLDKGEFKPLPYHPDNPQERAALDNVNDDFKDYGTYKIAVDTEGIVDRSGRITPKTAIIVAQPSHDDITLSCPGKCSQPALDDSGQQVVFVGR